MYLDMANADTATSLSRHETQLSNVKGLSYYGTERLTLIPDGTGVQNWQSCNITVQGIGRTRTYSLSGGGFYKAHFYADADGGTTVEEPVEFPDGRTVVFYAEEYKSTNMDASRVTSEVTNILVRGGGALIGAPIPDYTGPITVEKGVLSISSASCLGSPGANPINIMSGASLFATNCPDNILSGRTINLYGGISSYWTPLGTMKGKIRLCAASNLAIGTNVCINLKNADSAIYLCGNEWGSFKLSSGTIDLGGRTLTIESNWKRFETGATIKNGGALETKYTQFLVDGLIPKFEGTGTIRANYEVNIRKRVGSSGWTLVDNGVALHGNMNKLPVNASFPAWTGPASFTGVAKVADYAGTSKGTSNTVFTIAGNVSGSGTLNVGPGWLNLAGGANTYSGAVYVNGMSHPTNASPVRAGGGGIGVWRGAAVFPGASTVTLTNSARVAFMDDAPASLPKLKFDGAADQSITGGGCTNTVRSTIAGFEKTGSGTLTIASPVRVTAPAVVKGGTLKISAFDPREGRKLVWSDDFSGSSLDSTKWTTENAMGASDITYDNSKYMKVENGTLHFKAGTTSSWGGTRFATAHSVVTKNLMAYKYGYLEMRAKVPYSHGAWPSFWMKAHPNLEQAAWMSEIDIFEVFPSKEGLAPMSEIHKWTWSNGNATTPHVQYDVYRWQNNRRYDFPVTDNLSDEYHVYGFEWTHDEMKFYVDGCRYCTIDLNDDYYKKDNLAGMDGYRTFHYILLNNELMTRGHDSGSSWIMDSDLITTSDPLPEYTIDWIRLWQKDGEETRTKSGGNWSPVTASGSANVASRPAVDEMEFSAGTKLDLAGTPSYSVARLKGSPAVTNAVSFAVTERWTLTGSAAMSVDGALSFGAGAELALADESVFASVTPEGVPVATATDGITGTPALVSDDFTMRLSADGKSLLLCRKSHEPPVAAASDMPGFDYTNRVVTVTSATVGVQLALAATASDGTLTTATATVNENGEAVFDIATMPGTAYSYIVTQGDDTIAEGGFLTGAWNEKSAWFSASAVSGASVVSGGDWGETPSISNGMYSVDGVADFSLVPEAVEAGSNRLVRVDFEYSFDSFLDADGLSEEAPTLVGGLVAAVNATGDELWMAYGLGGWVPLYGDMPPKEGRRFLVRAEVDMSLNPPKMRYEVSEDNGATFAQLFADSLCNSRWITGAVQAAAVSGVVFDGQGLVSSVGGTLSNANVAEADGVGYASLADAIAASTNSLALLTNASWPTNAPVGTVTVNQGCYALQGVTPDGNGKVVVEGGYSAIPGEGRVNISLGQVAALGVATASKTPAEIAAALAADGANGIPLWKSYVLGLDPNDATATPKATIVMNGENVELALVGINVNDDAGATVTYKVYKFDDLANMAAEEQVGGDRAVSATAEVQKGASEPRMFYRLKVDVRGY
jgi:beta-glucanase (GH16 family)